MKPRKQSGFDPTATYVHLPDGGAATAVPVDDAFWPELMSGKRHYPGRMLTANEHGGPWKSWEMHPAGEELLLLVSGHMEMILDEPGGERVVELRPGQVCIVPRGVWHTADALEPSVLVGITAGEGTQHKKR